MERKKISELVEERNQNRKLLAHISLNGSDDIVINGHHYKIIVNENDAFDLDTFENKFVPSLSHYNYIVGDIGYNQLRLKGFYNDERNVKSLQRVSDIDTYLSEYCNFGSPYFILHNLEAKGYSRNHHFETRNKTRNFHHENRNKFQKKRERKSRFKGHKSFRIVTKTK